MNKRTAHLLLATADRRLDTIAHSGELLLEAGEAMDYVSAYYVTAMTEVSPDHGAGSASLLVDAMTEAGDTYQPLKALLEQIASAQVKLRHASELLPDLPTT